MCKERADVMLAGPQMFLCTFFFCESALCVLVIVKADVYKCNDVEGDILPVAITRELRICYFPGPRG